MRLIGAKRLPANGQATAASIGTLTDRSLTRHVFKAIVANGSSVAG